MMTDGVSSKPNELGGYEVTIMNLGKSFLPVVIDKLEKNLPFDEDVQELIDILYDVLSSMQ